MIFKGEEAPKYRWQRKLTLWEVNMVGPMQPRCLRWLETPITYDHHDYPDHVSSPGHFLLIVNPIVSRTCLTKVLMDGSSSLNILYANTLDRMGIPRRSLCPSGPPFYGIILGMQAMRPREHRASCHIEGSAQFSKGGPHL